MKQLLVKYLLPWLAYLLLQVWGRTLRVRHLNPEQEAQLDRMTGPYILTHWHSRIFFLLYYFRGRRDWNILVSPSQDAEVLARLGALLGYTVVRGSTYKNARRSARQLIQALKDGRRVVLVADGSRGPRHVAQPGSVQLARITGAPLIPMTYEASWKYEFNSWDRFVLPLPFSRCTLHFGSPINLPHRLDPARLETQVAELTRELNRITEEAGGSGCLTSHQTRGGMSNF